jgi:peptidoglycan/LPS O-acetylase OafA/YrhL
LKASAANQSDYMPQLDSLRFLAVLGVLVSHYWIPQGLVWLFADMDWGWIGVHLFFVLSGFLITGILLDCRHLAESTAQPPMHFVRQFYIRRFLRIFPIYYLAIGIALLFNFPLAREIWGWLITYSSNLYITVSNTWIGLFSHFWSLAVEEQFYLFWPWIILFFPRKWIPFTLLSLIILAPAYRLYAYEMHRFDVSPFDFKPGTFTLGNLDSLGMGALLAFVNQSKMPKQILQNYLSRIILPLGILLYIASLVLYHYHIKPSVFFCLNDFAVSLIFVWLISSTSIGFKGLPGTFLEFAPLKYLGKISYGIYVYHYFVPFLIAPFFTGLGFQFDTPGPTKFLVSSLVTIGFASLSWHAFEFPINNLKRHFQYAPKVQEMPPAPEIMTESLN